MTAQRLFSNNAFSKLIRVLALLILAFSFGCAKGNKRGGGGGPSYLKECVLPDDQKFSLQGKWNLPPIKISFFAGDWSSEEITQIQKAAKVWNDFFTASKGANIFDAGPDGVGHQSSNSQASPSCASGTISDGTVIYKRAAAWTKSDQAVALTTICTNATGGAQSGSTGIIYNGIMEFNYKNFFVGSATRFPDIQSIAVHELGHLLGLDHACGPLGQSHAGLPNVACPDAGSNPNNYLVQTVMFPQVFFDSAGNGEVKTTLTENDQGRANCLY